MQIQAIQAHRAFSTFMGSKIKNEAPLKEMSNEEVLQSAKLKMKKKEPVFTPKQKALLPVIEEFKSSGILDIMQENLEEANKINDEFRKTGKKSAVFEQNGKNYHYKKVSIPEENGYNVLIAAKDEDGEEIYKYTSKVRGGYSKNSVKSEFYDFGKVELIKQGRYGNSSFYVNNIENEDYYFAGDIVDGDTIKVDYIENLA